MRFKSDNLKEIIINLGVGALCKFGTLVVTAQEKTIERNWLQRWGPSYRSNLIDIYARILKARSHSISRAFIQASLVCYCGFRIAGKLVLYLSMQLLTLQLFKNGNDSQGKPRLYQLLLWCWLYDPAYLGLDET